MALAIAVPTGARGHGETSPLIRSVIDRVEPGLPGVRFRVAAGTASLMEVANTGPRELVLLAPRGEPFLRVGPQGAFGNLRSPYWYRVANPDGEGRPGAGAGPGARPRWSRVSREPRWAYYEHRLHPYQVRLPREARGTRRVIRLLDWEIALRHGTRPARLEGHIEFRPVLGSIVPALTTSPTPLPGVRVSVLAGRFPGLLLQNASRVEVEVTGRSGEPFARVGPRGARVNVRSTTWAEDQRARGRLPREPADPRAAPAWRRVAPTASLTWLESRARYRPEQPPDDVARRDQPVRLVGWGVPLRAGDRRAELRGTTSWLPYRGGGVPVGSAPDRSGTAAWAPIGGVLALVLALGGAAALRLRRARARSA